MVTGPNLRSTLEFVGSVGPRPALGEHVHALLQVTIPNYVPPGVSVRSRIDSHLFTCSFLGDLLSQLEKDPVVQTIALSQPIRPADRTGKATNRLRAFQESLSRLSDTVHSELGSLSDPVRATMRLWLAGATPEAIAESTGQALADVRGHTFHFRFRPAVWAAIQSAYQAAGTDNLAPIASMIDLRGLGPLLLDDRQQP